MLTAIDQQLSLRDVTVRFGERTVLDQVSLSVRPGETAGVIGDNGSGKSTLLRLIAGTLEPSNGTVTVAAPGGIGYLTQTLGLPGHATVADAIDHGLREIRDLESRLRHAEGRDYEKLVDQFEARGGYEADQRVEVALHGLGRPGLARDRQLGTLPGGDVARLALATVLAAQPQLLLLDEPTNDLDDEALDWLEKRLRAHHGTLIAVTHDRVFLQRLTSTVLEVDGDDHTIRRHGNGYQGYLRAKAAMRARQAQRHAEWRSELARHQSLVEANAARLDGIPRKMEKAGFGGGPFRARSRTHGTMGRIRSAKEEVTRLTANPVAPPPEPLRLTARFAASAGDGLVVQCTDVRVGNRLHMPQLHLERGERLLVTGANGAGKSTLLHVIAGELRPDSGTVARPERIGFLRQQDTGDISGTVLSAFADGLPGPADEHADLLLSLGLFRPDDLDRPARTLSVGQRRRIDLARLVQYPSEVILLDEPTNHLSPDLVEQLEESIADYAGAVVMVTHDRRIRGTFEGRRLHLENGRVLSS
ncbi:ribosomal protection-like ABC-F family protein [Catelliglobosispora koreensis]|uniref:ribosomal protection-like ABC-F family protein n=1 Tax=Catelliglobosispora koreensis TaxID=129052 RepID=UPI0003AA0271